METLRYRFDGQHGARAGLDHALVGVVASGNLEVLVERVPLDGTMEIEVLTAARGFGTIWQAVLGDFAARHPLRERPTAIFEDIHQIWCSLDAREPRATERAGGEFCDPRIGIL